VLKLVTIWCFTFDCKVIVEVCFRQINIKFPLVIVTNRRTNTLIGPDYEWVRLGWEEAQQIAKWLQGVDAQLAWPWCRLYWGRVSVNQSLKLILRQNSWMHPRRRAGASNAKNRYNKRTVSITYWSRYKLIWWLCWPTLGQFDDSCTIFAIFVYFRCMWLRDLDTPYSNKNLVIANRSRVSCAHNTLKASMGLNITPWPWNLD